MDYISKTPKMYLRTPQSRQASESPNNNSPHSYGSPGTGQSPSINYGEKLKPSLFSHVVTAAGPSAFRSSSGDVTPAPASALHKTARPPSRAQTTTSRLRQPQSQPRYSYGPSSTSASILASSSKEVRQGGPPTINYSGYPQYRMPRSYNSIEYDQHKPLEEETSVVLRAKPSAPILHQGGGRGPKAPRNAEVNHKTRAIAGPSVLGEGKFFQTTGLKVRKEFTANRNTAPHDSKPTLELTNSSNLAAVSSLVSAPRSSSRSPTSIPRMRAREYSPTTPRTASSSAYSQNPSPTADASKDKAPKMFYSSLLKAKPFSLSLNSSKQTPTQVKISADDHFDDIPEEIPHITDDSFNTDESGEVSEIDAIGDLSNDTSVSSTHSNGILPSEPKLMADLQVKQARSSRKIQDLEISNASLMAVNKFLEKKLRAQSRNIQHMKVSGSSPSELAQTDSESEEEDDSHSRESDDEHTMDGRGNLATDSVQLSTAEIDLATKTQMIEKRMQSHLKFLKSSEKVNQTIRNCLLISDSLIQQASISLEFEVDPTDLKYGLHVSNHTFISGAESSSSSEKTADDLSSLVKSESSPRNLRQSHPRSIKMSHPILEGLIEESTKDLGYNQSLQAVRDKAARWGI